MVLYKIRENAVVLCLLFVDIEGPVFLGKRKAISQCVDQAHDGNRRSDGCLGFDVARRNFKIDGTSCVGNKAKIQGCIGRKERQRGLSGDMMSVLGKTIPSHQLSM